MDYLRFLAALGYGMDYQKCACMLILPRHRMISSYRST